MSLKAVFAAILSMDGRGQAALGFVNPSSASKPQPKGTADLSRRSA
jgi:hypothetical protein